MNPFCNLGASSTSQTPSNDLLELELLNSKSDMPSDDGALVDSKSSLAALLHVVACEQSDDRKNETRTPHLKIVDHAGDGHGHEDTAQSPSESEAPDTKIGRCWHPSDRANDETQVRLEPKTMTAAAATTALLDELVLVLSDHSPKEHASIRSTKQFERLPRNAADLVTGPDSTKSPHLKRSENTTELGVNAESDERSNSHHKLDAAALSVQSTLHHLPDDMDGNQQRTAALQPKSQNDPTSNDDAITSDTCRTELPRDGNLKRGEGDTQFVNSRFESVVPHAQRLPHEAAPSNANDEENNHANVDSIAQQLSHVEPSIANVAQNARLLPHAARPNVPVVDNNAPVARQAQRLPHVARSNAPIAQNPAVPAAAAAIRIPDHPVADNMAPEPRSTDILLGRGPACYSHQGNQRFRTLIDRYGPLYDNHAPRRQKAELVQNLVDSILHGGGRFLQETSGVWHEVSPHIARKKVGHALRDARLRQHQLDRHRAAAAEARRGRTNSHGNSR